MMIRLNEAIRRRLGRGERGAATIETVGMYVVAAAILAAAVALVALGSSPVVGGKFRQAVCMITTLGQGECAASVTSAEDHKPTTPCVVSAKGHNGAVEASLVVTLGGSEQFLVEKLNNGKSRVTRGTGGKVGVEIGVGANFTTTWDDKTYGAAAKWDGGVAALFSGGEVYYADNPEEVVNLMKAHTEDVLKDTGLGDSGVSRTVVDSVQGWLGLGHDFPPPDETFIEGSFSIDTKAQSTLLMANAQAGLGVQTLLGSRHGADGTSTTYYKASLNGNISVGSWAGDQETGANIYAKAGLEGKADGIVEVERDSKGNISAVRVKSVLSGTAEASEKGGTVNDGGEKRGYGEKVVELPTLNAADQAVAQRYLNALGMGPMGGFDNLPKGVQNYLPIQNPIDALGASKEFARAANLRGFVTEQTFDDSKSNTKAVNFDVEALAKISGGATVETVNRTSTGAQYWDGSKNAPWTGCGEK